MAPVRDGRGFLYKEAMKYLLLLPAVILALLFTVWPLVEVVRMSLTATNFITTKWVGLANYAASLTDKAFLLAMANSALYIVLVVSMVTAGSLAAALLVFPLPKRWHDAARFVFYIPALSAGIIIANVWKWIFHINGPINWMLGVVGMDEVSWVAQWYTAIPMVSIVVSLSTIGSTLIIYLASMLSIDKSLFDAATIDGASPRQVKWRIVVPIIAPTIGMMALLAAIAAPQIFETIYAMAPYDYSATLSYHIYRQAFQMSQYGKASAQAIVLLLLTAGMVVAKNRIGREA